MLLDLYIYIFDNDGVKTKMEYLYKQVGKVNVQFMMLIGILVRERHLINYNSC